MRVGEALATIYILGFVVAFFSFVHIDPYKDQSKAALKALVWPFTVYEWSQQQEQ